MDFFIEAFWKANFFNHIAGASRTCLLPVLHGISMYDSYCSCLPGVQASSRWCCLRLSAQTVACWTV